MLQVVQNINNGTTEILEVPTPKSKNKHALIQTSLTLISSGTEKSLVDFGKAGLLGKAVGQPDKVKMVLDKAQSRELRENSPQIPGMLNLLSRLKKRVY